MKKKHKLTGKGPLTWSPDLVQRTPEEISEDLELDEREPHKLIDDTEEMPVSLTDAGNVVTPEFTEEMKVDARPVKIKTVEQPNILISTIET